MVSNETFLDYLYHLEIEDRQERAVKQRLKESFKKKGNLKAAEAVETGCCQSDASEKGSSKKAKKGKYCDWCTNHGKEDRFVHSHNEADCNFKKAAAIGASIRTVVVNRCCRANTIRVWGCHSFSAKFYK
jgi:hypothetical protein